MWQHPEQFFIHSNFLIQVNDDIFKIFPAFFPASFKQLTIGPKFIQKTTSHVSRNEVCCTKINTHMVGQILEKFGGELLFHSKLIVEFLQKCDQK
jgi:hypothetical protein